MVSSVMAVSLTTHNKQTLRRLLRTGRWNNESEILRYGLHLVVEEFESKTSLPEPLSEKELSAWYRRQPKKEQRLEKKLAKGSAAVKPEPIG